MKIIITENQLNRIILSEQTSITLSPPLAGRNKINSPYGDRVHPITKKIRKHHGVDIEAKSGSQVLSPADGIVIKAKCTAGACGGNIFIDHGGGLKTRYCHIKNIKVTKGESVTRGQVIGLSGGSKKDYCPGRSTGAHLHYEVYDKSKGRSTTNPVPYLNGATINTSEVIENTPKGNLTLWDGMGKGRKEMRDKVWEMQSDLVERNYILPRFGVDGKFGKETLQTVNIFQKDHGFEVSDNVTEEVLLSMKENDKLNKNPEINDSKSVKKAAKQGHIKAWSPAVNDAINKASDENGVSKELMYTIANIESGGNPTAKNKRSGASGLYQIMPKYFTSYGVNGETVWDPYHNSNAAAKSIKKKIKSLENIIGKTPTNAQVYMAHNQGTTGFKIIYTACKNYGNQDGKTSLQNAAKSLGYSKHYGGKIYRNMKGNKGNHPCQFMETWTNKYESKKTQPIS